VKRLLLSALIAAAMHAFLLGADFGRFGRRPPFQSAPQRVVLNLISRPAAKVEPAPARMVPKPEPEGQPALRPAIKAASETPPAPKPLKPAKPKARPVPAIKSGPALRPAAKTAANTPPGPKPLKPAKAEARPVPAMERDPAVEKKALPPPEPLPADQRRIPPAAPQQAAIAEPPGPPAPPPLEKSNPAAEHLPESLPVRQASGAEATPPRSDGDAGDPRSPETSRAPAATPAAGLDAKNGIDAAPRSETAVIEARPHYGTNPKPAYPLIARKKGYQGTVVLDVLVGREGRVVDMKIFRSSGHTPLDMAALTAVGNWTFEPGRKGAEAIRMWVRIPVRFELK